MGALAVVAVWVLCGLILAFILLAERVQHVRTLYLSWFQSTSKTDDAHGDDPERTASRDRDPMHVHPP